MNRRNVLRLVRKQVASIRNESHQIHAKICRPHELDESKGSADCDVAIGLLCDELSRVLRSLQQARELAAGIGSTLKKDEPEK